MGRKIAPAGGGGFGTGDNHGGDYPPNHTTKTHPIQQLIEQAERRMDSDPARFGQHSAIWLSLIYAANGWPWKMVGGAL